MRPLRRLCLLVLCALGAAGCSASTNVLGLLTPSDHKQEFDNLLDLAQQSYDRGDYQTALGYATEAYADDQASERAALLYGFVNLALAGGDPMTLAKALIAQGGKAPAGTTTSGGATSGALGSLKSLLGLPSADLTKMGTLDTSDPRLPVIIPGCAEAVRPNVPQLVAVANAINAVCPFVSPAARITADPRQSCYDHQGEIQQPAQAAFLWAFVNLVEALAFDSVLTYATVDPTGQTSNLQLRVQQLQADETTGGATTLVTEAQSLEQTVNAVLPPSGVCSPTAPTTMLQATVNDLLAVEAGFAQLPGVPASLVQSLSAALTTVEGAAAGAQAAVLRADFAKGLAGTLASAIDATGTSGQPPLTSDQKTALCASYASIAAGTSQASAVCGSP